MYPISSTIDATYIAEPFVPYNSLYQNSIDRNQDSNRGPLV